MLNDAHIAEEIRQLCATERPSVAVVDCMLLPALSAVQESGIPHAVLSHTFRGYLNGMHLTIDSGWKEVADVTLNWLAAKGF